MKVAAEESLDVLRARISSLQGRLAEVRSGVRTAPSETAEFERLRQRVQAVQDVYDLLVEEYYEAQIAVAVEAGDVAVVDAATPPLYPDPSRGPLKMMLALLAGLMVGSISAVMLEQLDKSVGTELDVQRFTRVPVLGSVPRVRSHSANSLDARLGKEAFRAIRTNIRFALATPPKSITVTSAEPGEGKSTVSANLAIALAEQGLRVVLVDADLRRPRVHELLHMEVSPGLADVLRGHAELEDAVRTSTVMDLHVVTGGRANGNAPELVGGEGFAKLLSRLEDSFDAVVIDTAPILAFTDAALISVVSDGTLIVARARKTDGNKLREAVNKLQRVGAPLAGIVLNGTVVDSTSSYYYEYYDGKDRGAGLTLRRALPAGSSSSKEPS
jgi:succinoglycan biosynthesis transport protein ExoP